MTKRLKFRLPFPLQVFTVWLASLLSLGYLTSALSDRRIGLHHVLVKWDAGWYLSIAQHGYQPVTGSQSNLAFFPLYPFFTRLISTVLHISAITAGVIVSLASFLGALLVIYQLTKDRWGENLARTTGWLVAFFPFSFFFGLIYTESLFLLLVASTLFALQRQRYWLAAGLIALAGATRLAGIFLIIPLVIAAKSSRRGPLAKQVLTVGLMTLTALSGLIFYMAVLWHKTGDALAFIHVQKYWPGREFGPAGLRAPLGMLHHGHPFSNPYAMTLTWLAITVIFACLAIYCLTCLDLGWGLFCLVAILVPLVTGSLESMNRYAMVLVPGFISAAQITEKRRLTQGVLVGSAALLAVFWSTYLGSMVFLG